MFNKLWNFEYNNFKPWHYTLVLGIVLGVGVLYVLGEVWFALVGDTQGVTILDAITKIGQINWNELSFETLFPYLWIAVSVFTIAVRVAVIFYSYIRSKQSLGNEGFLKIFYTYFTAFIVGFGAELVLVVALSGVAIWAGLTLDLGGNIISYGVDRISELIDTYVPNLINIQSYWLTLLISILVSGLPLYFVHWLSHKSRLVWYVFHRAHHVPQHLHPLAAPPAFVFNFLLALPSGLVAIAVSKLIHTEPLVMELALWGTFGYSMEIFNHSSSGYQFALKNFIVRNISRLYGDRGVYHLMHHSSKPGDEMINLSSGPWQLWDRVFGTYKAPYQETPNVGLTNDPIIHMNPMRIIFSGIAQLGFELKHNKSLSTRMRIIFGDIYYQPPVTRDYLIIGYEEKAEDLT